MSSHQLSPLNNEEIFEDAVCDLFNSLHNTISFVKYGKKGNNQKGIDIFSPSLNIAIQCKKKDLTRKDSILRNEISNDIRSDVNKILTGNLKVKFDTFYFVSTFKTDSNIQEFCEDLKTELNTDFEIIYWGWDILRPNFIENKSLLQKYWPNFIIQTTSIEENFKRNLDLKKKIGVDFGDWLNYSINNRKRRSRMLIRSFDGKQYPEDNDPDEFGEYSWFAAALKTSYHNGLEFHISGEDMVYILENGNEILPKNKKSEDVVVETIMVNKIGQINFSDIVDYDIKGDGINNYPHIFCRFKYKGTPFENYYYQDIKNPFNRFFI